MTDLEIRPATAVDLPGIYDVFYENEVSDESDPPPPGIVPSYLKHELATGEMLVAERDGHIIAFAALIVRSSIAYLAELFVRPAHQSTNIGKTLLHQIVPKGARICCTLSSSDPRALALYVRAGMRPQWPNIWLRTSTTRLGTLPPSAVEVVEAQPGDHELVRWDAAVSGRNRTVDHDYWIREGAVPLWFENGGSRVGYGYVQLRGGTLWFPEAITVGPVGTRKRADAQDCVCAAVEFARRRGEVIRLAVPGPHPGLGALLHAGFHIVDIETFVSTAATTFFDPACYVASGDLLGFIKE